MVQMRLHERRFVPQGNSFTLFNLRGYITVRGMKTPQQLSREAIDEFKAIYKLEFDQTLSDDEVQEVALRLLRFFGILQESLPNDPASKPTVR